MQVQTTSQVDIAMRTLTKAERLPVVRWLNQLKNWESDERIRTAAKQVTPLDNVYILRIDGDLCLFFRLEEDQITVVDLAMWDTVLKFASIAE